MHQSSNNSTDLKEFHAFRLRTQAKLKQKSTLIVNWRWLLILIAFLGFFVFFGLRVLLSLKNNKTSLLDSIALPPLLSGESTKIETVQIQSTSKKNALIPNVAIYHDVEYYWQNFTENPKGVVFFAHGCKRPPGVFWPKSKSCPQCIGLPIELEYTKEILNRGFLLMSAFPIKYRNRSDCWVKEDANDVAVMLTNFYQHKLGAVLSTESQDQNQKQSKINSVTVRQDTITTGFPKKSHKSNRPIPLHMIAMANGINLANTIALKATKFLRSIPYTSLTVINAGIWTMDTINQTILAAQPKASIATPASVLLNDADFKTKNSNAVNEFLRSKNSVSHNSHKQLNQAITPISNINIATVTSNSNTHSNKPRDPSSAWYYPAVQYVDMTRNADLIIHNLFCKEFFDKNGIPTNHIIMDPYPISESFLMRYLPYMDLREAQRVLKLLGAAGAIWPQNGLLLLDPYIHGHYKRLLEVFAEAIPDIVPEVDDFKYPLSPLLQLMLIAYGNKELSAEKLHEIVDWIELMGSNAS